nr:ribulose-phosphate 3-epimerase [bacterium]
MINPQMPPVMISPSLLAADTAVLGEAVSGIQRAGADAVHIDVMDGHFVPNLAYGPDVVRALKKRTTLPLDVHLMVSDPAFFIPIFLKAGADWLTFHVEAAGDKTGELLHLIAQSGAMPGLSLSPGTPVEAVLPYTDQCGMVLVMGVMPGFGGQPMHPDTLARIAAIRRAAGPRLHIEVDGGVRMDNAADIRAAGANILVSGTAIFAANDRESAIKTMRGEGK